MLTEREAGVLPETNMEDSHQKSEVCRGRLQRKKSPAWHNCKQIAAVMKSYHCKKTTKNTQILEAFARKKHILALTTLDEKTK